MEEIISSLSGEGNAFDYLLAWIGLVGTAVGLTLPKDIAMSKDKLILPRT